MVSSDISVCASAVGGHVFELAAERLERGADLVEDVDGLSLRITGTHHDALAVRRSRAADENAMAGPDRPRIAGDRLPAAAGVNGRAFGAGDAGPCLEDA